MTTESARRTTGAWLFVGHVAAVVVSVAEVSNGNAAACAGTAPSRTRALHLHYTHTQTDGHVLHIQTKRCREPAHSISTTNTHT